MRANQQPIRLTVLIIGIGVLLITATACSGTQREEELEELVSDAATSPDAPSDSIWVSAPVRLSTPIPIDSTVPECLDVSGDGRYVLFVSQQEVGRFDREMNSIVTVPDSTGGCGVSISNDGNRLAFTRLREGYRQGDRRHAFDVLVYDVETDQSRVVSDATLGSNECWTDISGDGSTVAWMSPGSLSTATATTPTEVYVLNLPTDDLELVSRDRPETGELGGLYPQLSADGTLVTFSEYRRSFLANRENGTLSRLDVFPDSSDSLFGDLSALSDDGQVVAYAVDCAFCASVDRRPGVMVRSLGGNTLFPVGSQYFQIHLSLRLSGDGRFTTFAARIPTAEGVDTAFWDVFLFDRGNGELHRLSVDPNGRPGDGDSWQAAISANGHVVVFVSDASGLVPDDANNTSDAFVVEINWHE